MATPSTGKFIEQGVGTVHSVQSGDTVSVQVTRPNGPSVIRKITLSNLQAPKFSQKEEEKFEPWAWQSREYLRQAAIGKQARFFIENKVSREDTVAREYGNVVINNDTLNLAEYISAAGWVDVRPPPDGKEPRSELHGVLIQNNNKAKELKIGLYQELNDQEKPIPKKLTPLEIFEKYKNRKLDGLIEYVRDGTYVTVLLKEDFRRLSIKVAGAQAPIIPSKKKLEEGEKAEPFAADAKNFVERHLLQRDITLTITAPGESGRNELYGVIEFAGFTLAGQLVKNGFAKVVEWNAPKTELPTLLGYQQEASTKKLRIWSISTNVIQTGAGSSKQWAGKVREIRDGALLKIENLATKEVVSINLSNVKVPRITKATVEPYAFEAKELLRTRTLGKKVNVVFDYTSNEKDYHSVFLDEKSLALMLIEKGLAKTRSQDNVTGRTSVYQQLTIAENRASAKGKNLFSKQAAPIHRFTDLTAPSKSETDDKKKETEKAAPNKSGKKETKTKAKQFLGFLKRAGRVNAVVEYVYGPSRVKLMVPSENCIINFGIEGVQTPVFRPEKQEPFGQEAFDFVYDKIFQRDVEIIVDNVDNGGNFWGALFIGNKSIGISLLESGLARLSSNVEYTKYATEYKQAETGAKNQRVRLWANWSEESERQKQVDVAAENQKVRLVAVTVSEIVDGFYFFVQLIDEAPKLNQLMIDLNSVDHPVIPNFTVKRGGLYCAKYSDNRWYRCKVEKVDKEGADIAYVDYGNKERIPISELRPIPSGLESHPPYAKGCTLAFLKGQGVGNEYGDEAADFFHSISWEKKLYASIEYNDLDRSAVSIGDGNSLINIQMVEAGLATVSKYGINLLRGNDERKKNIIKRLQEKQAEARKAHRGLWEYGDFDDSDSE